MRVNAAAPVVRIEYHVERHPDERCAELIQQIEFLRRQTKEAEDALQARLKEIGYGTDAG